jgi:hypothetical protein
VGTGSIGLMSMDGWMPYMPICVDEELDLFWTLGFLTLVSLARRRKEGERVACYVFVYDMGEEQIDTPPRG